VKVLPTGLLSLFKPQWLNPKKLGGKHGQKPQHNPKGNCTAEWRASYCPAQKKKKKKSYPCLIMPAKISCFFQHIPVFVGNLAQNSTRFSQSNEPFLLIKSCVFFFCAHVNNILSTPLYLQNHCTKNSLLFFPFFQNQAYPHVFTRIFGKSKFSTKSRNHVDVCSKQTSSGNSGDSLER